MCITMNLTPRSQATARSASHRLAPLRPAAAEKPRPLSLDGLRPSSFAFDGAIFDFDGTLANSWNVWHQVDDLFLAQHGFERPTDFSKQMAGRSFIEGARWVVETFRLKETPQEVCDQWNALGQRLYKTQVSLLPGALDYLHALKAAGVPIALATTNDPEVLSSLAHLIDFESLFDARLYGCDVARDKRFPDIYEAAARRLNISPASTVVFEDIPQGLQVASSAGFTAVGVLNEDPEQHQSEVRQAAHLTLSHWDQLL
ncbi:HAD family phosphatase [Muricaecibacterium torontonense]|uniref:HAD family phosphatase n=2 Tax=Muricaecibacterium torontonense TaxID=3032871 RepID=A0A4S2F3D9_9ACTN|nr:HAD family phosphatase [Muricaecibacterium torontonense]